jgi:hypothetical protein
MDEVIRGRVYGADHEDPGPRDGHVYCELVGGPLDGLLLDVTGRTPAQLAEGAALTTELGQYGGEGLSLYGPRDGDERRWDWWGDTR